MEQNADPGAGQAPVVERTGEVRSAVWLKFHQITGAKEILERTGRLPAVLRFKVPQTISAFRIPEGQSYRVSLPDGRKLVMREGVYEIDPPAEVKAGDKLHLRYLEPHTAARSPLPTAGELDAHLDAIWCDPALASEPVLPAGNAMTAVEEERIGELEADALELIDDSVSDGTLAARTSATTNPCSPQHPTLSFGIRLERHPGVFSRLFRTSHREGSR
jgi:hypothetical protein